MKSASVADIRRELKQLTAAELITLTDLLARYNNDNKAYLSYLLFDAHNKAAYIDEIKAEVKQEFSVFTAQSNLYFSKKTLRKVLRQINRYAKYTGDSAVLVDLLLFFCESLRQSGLPYYNSPVLVNLYAQTHKKAGKTIEALHSDLQNDYRSVWESLS